MHQIVEGEVIEKPDEAIVDAYEDCDEFDLAGSPRAPVEPTTKETIDRSFAAKMYIEQYYGNLSKSVKERGERRIELEKKMENLRLTNREQNDLRKELDKKETEFMRFKRKKMSPKDFDTIKIIGRGAFGEVRLVKMKLSDEVYAMKKLRKEEMLKKEQVAHVRAERDVLVHANSEWVVKLYYSFQDETYLYLIMEYLPGGDMMSLLIKHDIFTEEQTRFCIAETLLAIESVHALGFVHRDVKPDNLLLDEEGHVKLTDFGLCTGFHRMHTSAFYQKLVGDALTLKRQMLAETPLTERIASFKRSRRALAFSAVGTPDYTAPEVFLQVGYGMECDWWSLGVIMFEMLVGYPPFLSDNSTETCLKIINCKETLRFPEDAQISHDAQDLIEQLVCERSGRLSSAETIKAHPFFKNVNWETIRESPAPFVPTLRSAIDTSYFEEYEELPEPAPHVPHPKDSRPSKKITTDKDLPFIGYTYKGFDAGGRRSSNGSSTRRPTLDNVFNGTEGRESPTHTHR